MKDNKVIDKGKKKPAPAKPAPKKPAPKKKK
jgi:hypothetical protein